MSSPVKIEHSLRTKPSVQAQCVQSKPSQAKPMVSSLLCLVSWYESGPTSQAFTSSLPMVSSRQVNGVKSTVSSLWCQVHGVMSMVVSGPSESKVCAKYKFVKPSRSKQGVKSSSAICNAGQ